MDIAQEMLTTFNDDPDLLKKVIAGNESWLYGYDIETNAQSNHFATIEEIKQKSKLELLGDTKQLVLEVFQGLEKTLV